MKLAALTPRPKRQSPLHRLPKKAAPFGSVAPREPEPLRDPNTGDVLRPKPGLSWQAAPRCEFGRQAVQPKLEVGDVNDPVERQADAVAEQVMRMPAATPASSPEAPTSTSTEAEAGAEASEEELTEAPLARALASAGGPIQRKCSSCAGEEEELQRAPVTEVLQRACTSCAAKDDELQRSAAAPVNRACSACDGEEEELRREPAAGARGGPTSPVFTTRLHQLHRHGGQALSGAARTFFEPRFGAELGHVRVHTDPAAAALAKQINARAFTSGQHIFFGAGEHRPQSQAGQRLLAHELAHTLQNNSTLRAKTKLHRSAADDLVSSMDNTAEVVLDEVAAGAFYTSNEFEERIRKLAKSERKRLRTMMVSQSWADQEIVDELIKVLDNVIHGYLGGTVGHVDSLPCKPGDVEPVSMWEWTGDLVITDLELLEGSGESKGKLGRHTPSATLRLFQRALVQWGCESASPARNPLPEIDGVGGIDGSYGGQFRNAVRQFQRLEGLSVDGAAGPATVKAMAGELYGINLRSEVEREQDLDRAREQLDAEKASDAEVAAREARIQRFIDVLWAEGKRYRKNGSAQYEANVSFLVAQKISAFPPDIISEGLERVQLGYPDFYEHVLFGGRLITSLQELGVFGVEYSAPSDADFLDGFIIESRNLEHNSPLSSPKFSGWDIPEIYVGFEIGTAKGIGKGFVEAVQGIAAMFTAEFWKAMYEMVPKLIMEPNFRFEMGRASAEMLNKQLSELNASSPYGFGEKLGVLFGMLVFEVAVGILTGGAGAAVLKGVDGAKLLAKFPRLQKLGKRVASTSLVRAGVKIGSSIAKGAEAILMRVDALMLRVRKALPDLTSNAKLGRKLDEFDELDAELLSALADQKSIGRKLDEVELEQAKLELALDRAEPDLEQVDRLATALEKRAGELEELLGHKGPAKHGVSPAAVSKQTLELVEEGRDVQKLSKLPPEVLDAELHYVANADGREISLEIWDKHYDHEVVLPNGHTYRRDKKTNTWCRFSKVKKGNCGTSDSQVQASKAASDPAGGERVTKSPHAISGAAKGRNVRNAVNDVQRARDADIFRQIDDGRLVVRGSRGREHIIEPNGELVTTVNQRSRNAHLSRLRDGTIEPATNAEIEFLRSLVK